MSSVDVSVLDLATVRTGWSTSDALAAVRRHPADRVDGVRFVLFSDRLLAAFEAAQSR